MLTFYTRCFRHRIKCECVCDWLSEVFVLNQRGKVPNTNPFITTLTDRWILLQGALDHRCLMCHFYYFQWLELEFLSKE